MGTKCGSLPYLALFQPLRRGGRTRTSLCRGRRGGKVLGIRGADFHPHRRANHPRRTRRVASLCAQGSAVDHLQGVRHRAFGILLGAHRLRARLYAGEEFGAATRALLRRALCRGAAAKGATHLRSWAALLLGMAVCLSPTGSGCHALVQRRSQRACDACFRRKAVFPFSAFFRACPPLQDGLGEIRAARWSVAVHGPRHAGRRQRGASLPLGGAASSRTQDSLRTSPRVARLGSSSSRGIQIAGLRLCGARA